MTNDADKQIKDDGGPAFPHTITQGPLGDYYPHAYGLGGMSMRDYFAGKALEGFLSNTRLKLDLDIAVTCYMLADDMLKARLLDEMPNK